VKKLYGPIVKALGLLLTLIAIAAPAAADDYPSRSIRLIIPFPPGGSNDVVGASSPTSSVKSSASKSLSITVAAPAVVVGTDVAAKATPDGYTLLVISVAHAVDPWIYKETFDPIKDFVPVGIMGTGTNVLSVNPKLEFIRSKSCLILPSRSRAF